MRHSNPNGPASWPLARPPSPLMMSDRLISLAQEAGRAGCAATAERLVHLAHSVLDEVPDTRRPALM